MSEKRRKAYEMITGTSRLNSPRDPIEEEIMVEDHDLAREARRLRLEELVERRKNKLRQLKESGKPIKELSEAGTNLLSGVMQMAQIDPARAKEFLNSLSQEDITKLSMLSVAGKSGGTVQSLLPFLKSKETSIPDIVSIVKMMQPQTKPFSITDVATLVKVLQTSQPQSQGQNPMEMMKFFMELINPLREALNKKDREIYDAKLAQLTSQFKSQQVDPVEYLRQQKKIMEELGMSAGGKSEIDVRLASMAQDERLANRQISFEIEKFKQERADKREETKSLYDMVGKIAEGPLGRVAEHLGKAGATRLRGGQPSNDGTIPEAVQVLCPNCKKPFYADPNAPRLVCPYCGAILEKQGTPQQQHPQTPPQNEKTSMIREVEPEVAEPAESKEPEQ